MLLMGSNPRKRKEFDNVKTESQKRFYTGRTYCCSCYYSGSCCITHPGTGYIDKSKARAIESEAKGIWTAAQSAASEYYGLNIDEKSMENALTNSCTIDGITYTNCLGRISNATFSDEQSYWHKNPTTASQLIAQQVLIYLDSQSKNNSQYSFGNSNVPTSGATLANSIKNNFGSNPPKNAVFIQIFYDENCKVLAINFGKDGYLVTMTAGHSPICEKNGKIL